MSKPIVRKIDHVYVPLAEAEKAHRFMIDILHLPAAWPYMSYGVVASGGVNLGSANFETLLAGDIWRASDPARVQGIAFEPDHIDDAFLAELDRREIPHSPVMPFQGMWTNVFFGDFIEPQSLVFVCDYHMPEARNMEARRAMFKASGGGVLGVEDFEEVVVGSPAVVAAIERWARLLDPLEPIETGYWRVGDGPALRIMEFPSESVVRLVLRVRSVADAERALKELGVDHEPLDQGLRARPEPLNGLEFDLIS